jgi:hypothetical protein
MQLEIYSYFHVLLANANVTNYFSQYFLGQLKPTSISSRWCDIRAGTPLPSAVVAPSGTEIDSCLYIPPFTVPGGSTVNWTLTLGAGYFNWSGALGVAGAIYAAGAALLTPLWFPIGTVLAQ